MKTVSFIHDAGDLAATQDRLAGISPDLMFVFGSTALMSDSAVLRSLAGVSPKCQIVGCSTSGEITSRGADDAGLTVTAAQFADTQIRTAAHKLSAAADSAAVGRALASDLIQDGLKAVIVLAPGVNVNGTELVNGMRETLPAGVTLTGGLAGDGTRFQETRTMLNGESFVNEVIAVGFYGDRVLVGSGSKGGWKPFGPARRVTKSTGNILYELDGKPALQLYKDYLGDKAADLPASGLLYPFAIMREDRSTTGLIRTILDISHDEGSLTLAGDLAEGSMVCLMRADTHSLAAGAAEAATDAVANSNDPNNASLALLVSCVGRRLVMGEDVDEEIEASRDVLGSKAAICGFYSYGEIAPFADSGQAELHNQTMTITHITETA